MGVSGLGHVLALDAQGALDIAHVDILLVLPSRKAEAPVCGQARGCNGDSWLWGGSVYLPWSESTDEKLSYFLTDNGRGFLLKGEFSY